MAGTFIGECGRVIKVIQPDWLSASVRDIAPAATIVSKNVETVRLFGQESLTKSSQSSRSAGSAATQSIIRP